MAIRDSKMEEDFLKLVSDSCKFEESPIEKYRNFHKTLLKFSFGAMDVKIDYGAKTILIWNSKPSSDKALKLQGIQDAMMERISYTDLEETILGSLEDSVFSERFYRHLLYEYGDMHLKLGA